MLLKESNYKLYFSFIDLSFIKENYPELHYLYRCLEELHTQHPATDFSIDELSAYFFAKYPDAKKETYQELLKRASEAEISDEVGAGILQQIKQRQGALKLSEISYAVSQGRSSIEELQEAAKELDATEVVSDDLVGIDLDLELLLDSAIRVPGLRWRLDFLNKSLGSLRRGDFGFLMKRPETGGTAFLASEVSYMLDQTDEPIIWLNNEGPDNKVAIRVYQAYFGVDLQTLIGNSARYKEEFKRRVGSKFQFFGADYSNKLSIERIYKKYKPALIVYDQIDKLAGFTADREDLRLGNIYEWARNLCIPCGAAIGVTQASGQAEGVKWLNMSHTANSQTSKAAEAEFMLGIGKSSNPEEDGSRFISICKNKLIGDMDTKPEWRHQRMEVLIKPAVMRFEDIMSYD